jgi:putative phage-type endonuclease
MNMIADIEQRTEAWDKIRLGKVTASCISDVMAKTKSGYSASRKNYMMKLLCERLTGRRADTYVNDAMQRGIDLEAVARSAYEVDQGVMVAEVGFVLHPTIPMSGASPDGLVGADGLVEIKCPNTATHVEFLRTGEIDSGYKLQMLWQLECAGRSYCDFVSYDDRLCDALQYKCVRYTPTAAERETVTAEVVKFLAELDALETEMRGLMMRAAA